MSALTVGRLTVFAALVLALAAACVPPLTPPTGGRFSCTDASSCPGELVCDVEASRCLDAGGGCVIADGPGLGRAANDGAACNTADDAPGHCDDAVCVVGQCGDGVVDPGEACDLGTSNSDVRANACRSDCARSRCGDGVVDAGEDCDDDGAGCLACHVFCVAPAANCDGVGDCECATDDEAAPPGTTFTALATDGAAVWTASNVAVGDAILTRIASRPLLGGAGVVLTDLDGSGARELLVDDSHVYVSLLSRIVRIDKQTAAVVEFCAQCFAVALGGDDIAFQEFQDGATRLVRAPKADLARRTDLGELRFISSMVFVGADLFFVVDGELLVATSAGTALVVPRANIRLLIQTDGAAVYWVNDDHRLMRLGADRALTDITPDTAVPLFLVTHAASLVWATGRDENSGAGGVFSLDAATGASALRASGFVSRLTTVGDDVFWLDDITEDFSSFRTLRRVRLTP